jgi:Tfp pilus assembly protein PilF
LLLGQQGKLFEGIASLERALALEDRDFACIKNLAILYQQAGFVTKSAELWHRALPLAPDSATKDSIRERLLSLSS